MLRSLFLKWFLIFCYLISWLGPNALAANKYENLGKTPDLIGHSPSSSGIVGSSPVSSRSVNSDLSPQVDNKASADNFNNILKQIKADAFTGRLTMSIPIIVPGGTRDIKPQVSLDYDMSARQTRVGRYWRLKMPSVSRSVKNGVPVYDDNTDSFMSDLEGSVLVKSNDGFYYTEINNTFNRYSFINNTWVMQTTSGVTYEYGLVDESKISNAKGIFQWYLDKITDSSGNYIKLSYIKDAGQVYIDAIEYTYNEDVEAGYKIEFEWEDRADTNTSYISGGRVVTNWRLSEIQVKYGLDTVKKYVLSYIQSVATKASLLESVTEYGKNDFSKTGDVYARHYPRSQAFAIEEQGIKITVPGNTTVSVDPLWNNNYWAYSNNAIKVRKLWYSGEINSAALWSDGSSITVLDVSVNTSEYLMTNIEKEVLYTTYHDVEKYVN